ncbi:MAG: ASKHA domain-containing protein, partial [Pseudomonadota bacterium]
RKAATERKLPLDPATCALFVTVDEPDMHEPSGDLERLRAAMKAEHGLDAIQIELGLIQRLQPILRDGGWRATALVHKTEHGEHLLDLLPGHENTVLFGVAVDLGSTTIAAHLCDLSDGRIVGSAGAMNPQIRFGEDLMSRVSYAMMNPGGAGAMTEAVRTTLDGLVAELAQTAEIPQDRIVEMVVVCNPVMHHLLLGIDPVELGQSPFALAAADALSLPVRDLELVSMHPAARLYVLPCIAGHVGADAAAVALAEAPEATDALTLIVDVGTNAELLLGNRERVLACSSPTGPAFEGAQISSGQRAAPGAIERVEIDPETKTPRFRVIGCDLWSDAPGFGEATQKTGITGICGSGIIEAVAEMRMAGLVDSSGLIGSADQTGSDRCVPEGRTHTYVLHDASADGGPRIAVTQGDIRAIQLAKSALYAGARLLMDEIGTDRVDEVVLAGAFGAHISVKHAMAIGMIPDAPLERVRSAGNAAGTGALMALLDRSARRRIETGVRAITKVETAIEPRFQEHFVAANALPHASDPFPELAKSVTLPVVTFNTGGGGEGSGNRRRRRRGS